jgi:hypothetical protein
LAGESGQWDPVITENNKTVGVPAAKDGKKYYFPDDMADKTIGWLHAVRAQDPAKPWFVYFSTGCAHVPHQVPDEWAAKYKGRFDGGWDALREETFERQKRLGVIPADAQLTPRDEAFPAWDSLPEDQRRLYARQMEVYAGYCENADQAPGRAGTGVKDRFACTLTRHFHLCSLPCGTSILDAAAEAYHDPAVVWWGPLRLPGHVAVGHLEPVKPGFGSSRENGVWGVPRRVREGRRFARAG